MGTILDYSSLKWSLRDIALGAVSVSMNTNSRNKVIHLTKKRQARNAR